MRFSKLIKVSTDSTLRYLFRAKKHYIVLVNFHTFDKSNIGVGRGGGAGGAGPPIIWEGGPTYPLPPPPPRIIHPHFPSISIWNRKESKLYQVEGYNNSKCNFNLIWRYWQNYSFQFYSSISILSDFTVRNVIIWHWFIKNLVGTWRRNDVDATSLRRIDVSTTSCAYWEFGPPLPPPPIF